MCEGFHTVCKKWQNALVTLPILWKSQADLPMIRLYSSRAMGK